MKSAVARVTAGVGVVMVMAAAMALAADMYPANWDNIDLDMILSNDRLIKAYVNCLLDQGPCTAEATSLKKFFPEAIKTNCAKCTQKQKDQGKKAIKFMMEKKPELWKLVVNKYDPEEVYTKKFRQQ